MTASVIQLGFGYAAGGAGISTVSTGTDGTGTSGSLAMLTGTHLDVFFSGGQSNSYSCTLSNTGTAVLGTPISVMHWFTNGAIITFGSITGGSGLVNGTYYVSPTGGTGTGGKFQLTVTGGSIAGVLTFPGSGYVATDTLSVAGSLLGGTGTVSIPLATVNSDNKDLYRFIVPITTLGSCVLIATYGQTFTTFILAVAELGGIGATTPFTAGQYSAGRSSVATGSLNTGGIILPAVQPSLLGVWAQNFSSYTAAPTVGSGLTSAGTGMTAPSTGQTIPTMMYEYQAISSTATPVSPTAIGVANFNSTYLLSAIFNAGAPAPPATPAPLPSWAKQTFVNDIIQQF